MAGSSDVVDGILAHREDPLKKKAFGAHRVYRNTVFEGPPDWDADRRSVMLHFPSNTSAIYGKHYVREK